MNTGTAMVVSSSLGVPASLAGGVGAAPRNLSRAVFSILILGYLVFLCKTVHLLEHLSGSIGEASAFGSGHDPRVLGSSPTSGSLLSRESASLSPCAPPPACALSLSNK